MTSVTKMRKILTYYSLIIVSLATAVVFVSITTYAQLAVAILLFPLLAYFACKVFPRKTAEVYPKQGVTTILEPATLVPPAESVTASVSQENKEDGKVVNIDKRAFLKLIGGAGISLFLYSIFVKKAEVPFFGRALAPGTVSLEDAAGRKIDPAEKQPTDGYRITELDDSIITFYGFTDKNGSWFIMREDTDTGSFRYSRGDSNFTDSWTKREQLNYDYFNNVF